MKHIVSLVVSQPDHDFVSMRSRRHEKTYLQEARSPEEAINRAARHFKSLGFMVHAATIQEQKAPEAVKQSLTEGESYKNIAGKIADAQSRREDAMKKARAEVDKSDVQQRAGKAQAGSGVAAYLKKKAAMMPEQVEVSSPEYIEEKLTAADPASKWIHDFVHSDNPKFEGKSKKERINQALGAYYAAKRALGEQVEQMDEGLLGSIGRKLGVHSTDAKPSWKHSPKWANALGQTPQGGWHWLEKHGPVETEKDEKYFPQSGKTKYTGHYSSKPENTKDGYIEHRPDSMREQAVKEGSEGISIEDMVMDQHHNGNEVSEIASNMGMSEDEVHDIINDGGKRLAVKKQAVSEEVELDEAAPTAPKPKKAPSAKSILNKMLRDKKKAFDQGRGWQSDAQTETGKKLGLEEDTEQLDETGEVKKFNKSIKNMYSRLKGARALAGSGLTAQNLDLKNKKGEYLKQRDVNLAAGRGLSAGLEEEFDADLHAVMFNEETEEAVLINRQDVETYLSEGWQELLDEGLLNALKTHGKKLAIGAVLAAGALGSHAAHADAASGTPGFSAGVKPAVMQKATLSGVSKSDSGSGGGAGASSSGDHDSWHSMHPDPKVRDKINARYKEARAHGATGGQAFDYAHSNVSEGTTPTTAKEKELAAKAGDPTKITKADVLVARGVKLNKITEAVKKAAAKKAEVNKGKTLVNLPNVDDNTPHKVNMTPTATGQDKSC